MSETGLKLRKERDFCIRKSERARQTQSPKNKAKIMKGGVLTSTLSPPLGFVVPISQDPGELPLNPVNTWVDSLG
jgi:hypothetical protein